MKPAWRRQLVDHARSTWKVSIPRACSALATEPSTYNYKSRRAGQATLCHRMMEIAATRVRYGYRRIHVLLRREGWPVNEPDPLRPDRWPLTVAVRPPAAQTPLTPPTWPVKPWADIWPPEMAFPMRRRAFAPGRLLALSLARTGMTATILVSGNRLVLLSDAAAGRALGERSANAQHSKEGARHEPCQLLHIGPLSGASTAPFLAVSSELPGEGLATDSERRSIMLKVR